MKKSILDLAGAKELTKKTLQNIKGGDLIIFPNPDTCGGDGSYIIQNGVKVCCYVPADTCTPRPGIDCPAVVNPGSYIC